MSAVDVNAADAVKDMVKASKCGDSGSKVE